MSLFKVPYSGTLTAAGGNADWLYLAAGTNKPCRLVGIRIAQFNKAGDANEFDLALSVIHLTGTLTPGSGGSAVTPVDTNRVNPATAGCTARCNDATVATGSGTSVTEEETAWNNRNSPAEVRWLDAKEMPICPVGEALVVRCNTTVPADMSIALTFFVEEVPWL